MFQPAQSQPQPHQHSVKTKTYSSDLYLEQHYVACLAEFSYYVESNQEALIIDPLRDPGPYLEILKNRGSTLKYILETHLHADFVSGHLDLQKATGAKIVFGPNAKTSYPIHQAVDGELLELGKIKIRVDHTPGHTPESSCFVIIDTQEKPYAVFTGDTLFLNEIGRPDLAVSDNLTAQDLAGMLYDSLRNKIMKLPDDCIVYPAHGQGSACGKSIGSGFSCTVGVQKQNNYALQNIGKEELVSKLLAGMPKPPQYFFHDAALNKGELESFNDIVFKCNNALNYQSFQEEVAQGSFILDSRVNLNEGLIDGALNIFQGQTFALFVGNLIKPTSRLVLVTDPQREYEAVIRLIRIGYHNIAGYLDGGFQIYQSNGGKYGYVKIVDLSKFLDFSENAQNHALIDVRRSEEFQSGSLPQAINIELYSLESQIDQVPKDKILHVFCKTGGRAKIAVSILRNHGFKDLVIVKEGGASEIAEACKVALVTN